MSAVAHQDLVVGRLRPIIDNRQADPTDLFQESLQFPGGMLFRRRSLVVDDDTIAAFAIFGQDQV